MRRVFRSNRRQPQVTTPAAVAAFPLKIGYEAAGEGSIFFIMTWEGRQPVINLDSLIADCSMFYDIDGDYAFNACTGASVVTDGEGVPVSVRLQFPWPTASAFNTETIYILAVRSGTLGLAGPQGQSPNAGWLTDFVGGPYLLTAHIPFD